MKKVAIVGFKNSNLKSIYSAIQNINFKPEIISKPTKLKNFSYLVLPGVGAFKEGMKFLKSHSLNEEIIDFANQEKKILAICLGMQLLLEEGFEFGKCKGLGIVKGSVKKLESNNIHLGWNLINFKKNSSGYKDFFGYFVHSYYTSVENKKIILSETKFKDQKFVSSYKFKNILGCQFHPEKSGKDGLRLLKIFFNEKNY